jgi:hypothetical protein
MQYKDPIVEGVYVPCPPTLDLDITIEDKPS